jgi:hypothetical protein
VGLDVMVDTRSIVEQLGFEGGIRRVKSALCKYMSIRSEILKGNISPVTRHSVPH